MTPQRRIYLDNAATSWPKPEGVYAAVEAAPQIIAAEAPEPLAAAEAGAAFDISSIPGLRELWAETTGDSGIRVAVLDGPVDLSHPCFAGADLTRLPTDVAEVPGGGRMSAHGTHVASMIFGQPGSAVRGVAPACQGLIIPIFSDARERPASQANLARAIHEAVDAGAHVINVSGGELSDAGQADASLAEAVRHAAEQGALIVAAAGNDACRCLHVPAGLPSVLAVGATDAGGAPLDTSNWGEAYESQGILAPGQNMLGAMPGGGTALRTGTSFATPVVSGIAALLLSLQRQRGQKPDPRAVRDALLRAAVPCDTRSVSDCRRFLAGQIDVSETYSLISQSRRSAMSELSDAVGAIPANAPAQISSAAGVVVPSEVGAEHGALAPSESPADPAQAVEASSEAAAVQPASTCAAAVAERPPGGQHPFRAGSGQSSGRASGVAASCACQVSDSVKGGKVYVLGSLGYDFGTEARRDGFTVSMPSVYAPTPAQPGDLIPYIDYNDATDKISPYQPNPYDPRQMVSYLAGYPRPTNGFPTEGGFQTSPPPFPPPPDPRAAEKGGYPVYPPIPPDGYPGLSASFSDAAQLIWTLNIDLTPVYAIRPAGNFSTVVYQRLVEFLEGQVRHPGDPEYVSRVAIPGILTGETVKLYSGQVVPVIEPQVRGMATWQTTLVINAAVEALDVKYQTPIADFGKALKEVLDQTNQQLADANKERDPAVQSALIASINAASALTMQTLQTTWQQQTFNAKAEKDQVKKSLQSFLDRIYFDLRNPGQSSSDRALNYAATNAFGALSVLSGDAAKGMQLDTIGTEKSVYCRKDSDCWDVKIRLFDPENVLRARLVARWTINVSDVYPVAIGDPLIWSEAP